MPTYKYVARNPQGKKITGVIEAPDELRVVDILRRDRLILLDLKETKPKVKKTARGGKIKSEDLVIFSRQLATMIQSGVSLVQALNILSEQTENPEFKRIILEIQNAIQQGSSFCDALSKYPKVFSDLYINMIKAGEASGLLDEILDRLALYLEKNAALEHKLKSSMIYPVVVILMASAITSFLLLKVIPTFKGIFDMLGGKLPLPTRILIAISDNFRKYFIFGVLGLGIIVGVGRQLSKKPAVKRKIDARLLRMPIFGEIIQKVAIAKFSRTLSTLVKSGVSILQSLEIVAKTAGNKVVEEAVLKARDSIKEGEPIADPLKETKIFPPMVIRMISIGEQTGKLEFMLSKIADFYDEQVENAVSGLTSLIEPLIILFLGVVIGGIVISLFLPILKITQLLGR